MVCFLSFGCLNITFLAINKIFVILYFEIFRLDYSLSNMKDIMY